MPLHDLIQLSHELGREDRQLAILGEGNASAREADGTFRIKASGGNLGTIDTAGLTVCRSAGLLALLDVKSADDTSVEQALLTSRLDAAAKKPSTEAMFHAWLLTLPGVNFVGHTHPVAVNGVLCTALAGEFARRRRFPDEIVCCGETSVLVPYVDPGLQLARAIRRETRVFLKRFGRAPRTILLQNHGLIAAGPTAAAVLATTLMTEKAARIFIAAASVGERPRSMPPAQVARIANRSDEHHRQKVLGL